MTVSTSPDQLASGLRVDLASMTRQLLECAVGAEIGLFAPQRSQPPATCRRLCLEPDGEDNARGPCAMIERLLTGDPEFSGDETGGCELGHDTALHALREAGEWVLLLAPRREEPQERDSGPSARLHAAGHLWEQCRKWIEENTGLAGEVLRSYEQLNVLFDVTQQICKAQEAPQIKLFLIHRLAETFQCDWACCLSPKDGVLWWCPDKSEERRQTIQVIEERCGDLIQEVREQQVVKVSNRPMSGDSIWPSLLLAPLSDQEGAVDILVFGRRPPKPDFLSGDMLMIDSVLNHARHVIANLRLTERLRTMSLESVRAFSSAIDKKDRYTSGHSGRVGFLSRLIGQELGLSAEELQDLEWGGILHDVGKIGIHEDILCKPGRLTPEEFAMIQQHSMMSHEITAPIQALAPIRDIVLFHHETPDGTGYPAGLKGDEIPLLASVVHVADTFDALTTSRSYRSKFSLEKALEIMHKDSGTKLDGRLVEALETAFQAFRLSQPDRFAKLFPHIEEEQS
ncbi:MAG: HD-GYP domain-containing protein [Planctomycetes bacterium]|nr:HD-GYP domain-containing protein [Planctomycetota bacterium]